MVFRYRLSDDRDWYVRATDSSGRWCRTPPTPDSTPSGRMHLAGGRSGRRRSVASYLSPPDGADLTIIREDYAEALAVVPLDRLLDLLTG